MSNFHNCSLQKLKDILGPLALFGKIMCYIDSAKHDESMRSRCAGEKLSSFQKEDKLFSNFSEARFSLSSEDTRFTRKEPSVFPLHFQVGVRLVLIVIYHKIASGNWHTASLVVRAALADSQRGVMWFSTLHPQVGTH